MTIRYQFVRTWPTEAVVALYEAGGWWHESAAARAGVPALVAGSFRFLVATDGDETVAMGRAISDGASDAYVQDVVVRPSHRGRGIGREVIARLTAALEEAGVGWIGLVAEPGTTAFYERLGYRVLPGYVAMRRPTAEAP